MAHSLTSFAENVWQNLSTCILVIDDAYTIQFANNSCSELFGLGLKRLLNQPLLSIFNHHNIDLEKLSQYVLDEGVDCQQHRVDVVFIDNRSATLNIYSRKIVHQHQAYILLECRKIDDEVKFDQASKQMHQYHAARTLIRGLAHEIKNPLGGIRGAAQLLQYETCQQEREQCAQLIIEQADRLTELVDKLLGPNQLPNKTSCNIHQLLESVIKLCSFEQGQHISLKKDYDPSIPDVVIDQAKIQQVILNIVRNAQQALKQGGEITLKTRFRHRVRQGDHVVKKALLIQISDNGPGIDEQLKDTLFYPMVTNKEGGSGLGLSIAQTLIEQHGGSIECDSWPGHTEFNIYLPFTSQPSGNHE